MALPFVIGKAVAGGVARKVATKQAERALVKKVAGDAMAAERAGRAGAAAGSASARRGSGVGTMSAALGASGAGVARTLGQTKKKPKTQSPTASRARTSRQRDR